VAQRARSPFPGFDRLGEVVEDQAELLAALAARRRRLGLSQTEVAARMGTSQSAVARLEAGEADVRLSTLGRYASALDQPLAWLLCEPGAAPAAEGGHAGGGAAPGRRPRPRASTEEAAP
jgi:transcriptional regulator with XRE-family HTH domain